MKLEIFQTNYYYIGQTIKTKKANRAGNAGWSDLENQVENSVLDQRTRYRVASTLEIDLKTNELAKGMTIDDSDGDQSFCLIFMKIKHLPVRADCLMITKENLKFQIVYCGRNIYRATHTFQIITSAKYQKFLIFGKYRSLITTHNITLNFKGSYNNNNF